VRRSVGAEAATGSRPEDAAVIDAIAGGGAGFGEIAAAAR